MTKKKNELWEWTKALLIAVILAAVIRYFLICTDCGRWIVNDADITRSGSHDCK